MNYIDQQALEEYWDNGRSSTLIKPKVLYGLYGNMWMYTLSDNQPVYFFYTMDKISSQGKNKSSSKRIVYAAVKSKCILEKSNDLEYYSIEGERAIKPVSCRTAFEVPGNPLAQTFIDKFIQEQ